MVSAVTIIYIIVVVVVVILLFILGLFTKISGTFMIILILALLAIVFFTSAIYVTSAATDTGGSGVDGDNKNAHGWYVTSSVISWIIIGLIVIAIILLVIGAIFLFSSGTGEAAAAMASTAGAQLGLSAGQIELATTALIWAQKQGSKELLSQLKHDEAHGLFDSLNKSKSGFGKFIKYVVLFVLYASIILALVVGLFTFIGAINQSGSSDQKGLGKAYVSAILSMFTAISVIVFIVVMHFREKNRKKAYAKDVEKATEEYTKDYYKQYYPDYYSQTYGQNTQPVQVPQQNDGTYTPYTYVSPQPLIQN